MLLLRFLRNLRTYWSPSWPFLFPSVEFCEICYSCYFCHICCAKFSHCMKNSCYFCDFFAKFADISKPFCYICYSIFSQNSRYFCDFCDIFYFFYIFLIAVFFRSFLLKLRKQFASKFLLTRSILDISGEVFAPLRSYYQKIPHY